MLLIYWFIHNHPPKMRNSVKDTRSWNTWAIMSHIEYEVNLSTILLCRFVQDPLLGPQQCRGDSKNKAFLTHLDAISLKRYDVRGLESDISSRNMRPWNTPKFGLLHSSLFPTCTKQRSSPTRLCPWKAQQFRFQCENTSQYILLDVISTYCD